jgi:pimeloyl-ACP methyl ester carboxylesterase
MKIHRHNAAIACINPQNEVLRRKAKAGPPSKTKITRFHHALVTFSLALLTLSASSYAASEANKSAPVTKPTVVLVHGAFAGSSSWNGVVKRLLAQGYPVIAAANPLRGLHSDADYVAAIFKSIPGPIVAVGHSYGGSVITNAAVGNSNVKALVYVAGLAPEAGESAADISGRFPGSTLGPTLAPPTTLPDGGKDLYIQQDKFPLQFAADVPKADAKLMAVTQRPVTGLALNEAAGEAAWKTIPSWFIFGSLDKNITEKAHQFMAQRANAKATVEVKGASHVVMVSHPDAVAALIIKAAESFKP